MRDLPQPGPALPFEVWCRLVVDQVRRRLPAVRATRRGAAVVILRLESEQVTITNDRGTFWVSNAQSIGSRLVDSERHDAHTARTIARSIIGMLDARLSGPD